MDEKTKEQIRKLLAQNEELVQENRILKQELSECIGAVNKVMGAIVHNGQLNMQKAMSLITRPQQVQQDVQKLMKIVEKHG